MEEKGFLHKLLRWRPIRILIIMLKRIVLPGFDGIPLYNILVFFFRSLIKGAIGQRAAAISFNFFLALFPAILFFFTLIPFIPVENFQLNLMKFIENAVPDSTYQTIEATLLEILLLPHSGLMSIGFFMTLFFATNGVKSIMTAFETSYYNKEQRSFFQTQWVSILLLLLGSFTIIFSISLITFNRIFLDFLIEYRFVSDSKFMYFILYSINVVLQILMVFFIISFVYYYAPVNKKEYRFISAGSTFATGLYFLSFYAFDEYINHFSRYNVLYGSIGTLIIILMWIYINSFVLLIGYELNVSISTARKSDLFSLFRAKKEIKKQQKKVNKLESEIKKT